MPISSHSNQENQNDKNNSNSNASYVEGFEEVTETENVATFDPPVLILEDQNKEENEEETLENIADHHSFDIPPPDDDVNADDDNPKNNGADVSSSLQSQFQRKASNNNQAFILNSVAQLKHNYEQKYGFDLSNINIVTNSSEPTQMKAHAFAKGSEVHLGPGQEKHLPHELGHIIQQKQGKVSPTTSEIGNLVNDDLALEKEADEMGQEAIQFQKKPFSLPFETSSQPISNSNSAGVYQFAKPTSQKDEKVEKKLSVAMPDINLPEKKLKYVNATLGVSSGLEVAFMVDKKLENLPDEVAIGPKGLAVKKEGPNLVKSEIADKLNIEVKNGIEINSFGGKAGVECKLGDKSLFAGAAIEFSYVEMDWKAPLEDKIKIFAVTLKSPTTKYESTWTMGGEPHKVTAKYNVQLGLDLNKTELLKQILSKFGHVFTAEVAIAGGMILAGAMAIGIALHNVYMGKDIRERIDANIENILNYGKGFMTGFTGKSTGSSSMTGILNGLDARISILNKMPNAVFEEKLNKEGADKIFFDAMYKAVQAFKIRAIEQFKKDHDIDSENDSNNDLKLFKKVLDASTSSNYLQKKIFQI